MNYEPRAGGVSSLPLIKDFVKYLNPEKLNGFSNLHVFAVVKEI